ncbi:hypothetical protein MRB53_028617 [Persea americana]|uniref:Uncharacterized protein n=1 Tax=Persea americana TaxID=3435 RepID=A0ACC2KGH3_PERAE|nr:hypothetical protein MRB53_028617 [Persea americana]
MADGSIPDADSLNSKVLQVEAAGGRILSDDGVAVMETPGSGENRSDLFIPKTPQLKDAAEIPSRADMWVCPPQDLNLHLWETSLVDPVNALRTTILREEKDYGRVLSDEEIQALVKPVSDGHVEHCMPLSNRSSSLFKTSISSSSELEHCMQPSTDPDVHVKFEDEDTSAANLN